MARNDQTAFQMPAGHARIGAATPAKPSVRAPRRLILSAETGCPGGDGQVFLARLQDLLGEELDEPLLVTFACAGRGQALEVRNALRSIGQALASLYCADYYARASGCGTANLAAALAVRLRYQLARQLTEILKSDLEASLPVPPADEGDAGHVQQEDLSLRLIGAVYESNGIRAAFALLDWAVAKLETNDWLPAGDYSRFLNSYSMLRFGIAPWQTKSIARGEGHAHYEANIRTADRKDATGSGTTRVQAERMACERYVQTHLAGLLGAATSLPTRDMVWPAADDRLVPNEGALAALVRAFAPTSALRELFGVATFQAERQQPDAIASLTESKLALGLVGNAVLRLLIHSRMSYEYVRCSARDGRPSLPEYLSRSSATGLVRLLSETLRWADASPGHDRRLAVTRRSAVIAAFGACFESARDGMRRIDEVLPPGIPEADTFIDTLVTTSIQRDVRSLRHEKTVLIERCQMFGLAMAFESKSEIRYERNYVHIRLRLTSKARQLAEADLPEMEAPDSASLERQLSRELVQVFDGACGVGPARSISDLSGGLLDFGRLFLCHAIGAVSGVREGLTAQRVLAHSKDLGVLGVHWLRLGALDEYLAWLSSAEALIGRHVLDEHVLSFYGDAGDVDRSEVDPLHGMRQVCSDAVLYLEAVVDEGCSDILSSAHFAAVGELASIHRLLATPRRWISAREVLVDVAAQLAMLRWRVADLPGLVDAGPDCWLRPGIALEAIGQLLNATARIAPSRAAQDCVRIKMSDVLAVQVHLHGLEGVQIDDIVQFVKRSSLFEFMTVDAPVELTIDERSSGVSVLALRFRCGREGAARVALSTYRSGRPLPADVCAALASRLHDAKNELVACAAATTNAAAAFNRTDRLRHMLSGSQHLDGALGHLRTVQELLGVDRTVNLEELDLLAFFRVLTTELLTWVPRSVSVVLPYNLEEATFVTDPLGLRAAIVNLCKNSVEAMESKGRLSIAWRIDELEQLHVLVEDSGPGFTSEQLALLNAGEVLTSSKQTGSGSGLLSVRLLLDRLAGRVVFRSLEPGALVELVVPAALGPAAEDSETGEITL